MLQTLTFEFARPARRDLAIGLALATGAVAWVMADCILFQMATGEIQAGLALRWLVGAVLPWAAVFVALRLRVSASGGRPSLDEATLVGAAFVGSLVLDAILIPPDGWAEVGARVQARLALAALIPLAARLRLAWAPRARPAPPPASADRRFAQAAVVTAAGNYVEVEGPCGRRLVRMTISEAEQRMAPERRLRIHRSILVARDLVERLERDRNGVVGVRLLDGRRFKVGPSYRAAVRRAVEG